LAFARKNKAVVRTFLSSTLPMRESDSFVGGILERRAAMQLKTASRLFFAFTIIALGLIGLIGGGFASIWDGVPRSLPGRALLAGVSSVVSLVVGLGLLSKRTAGLAALALAAFMLLWTALFKIPVIIRAPLVEVSYQSTGQNLLLMAASWILFATLSKERNNGAAIPPGGDVGSRIALFLYGMSLVAFGLAQLVYPDLTIPLVPRWLPDPPFWARLTAGIYIVSGLAIAAGFAARLMLTVSALQITAITLLVWGNMILTGQMSAMYWEEATQSWALTAGSWLMAIWCDGDWWPGRLRLGGFALKRAASG
jgi:uncharacterized membrane protein